MANKVVYISNGITVGDGYRIAKIEEDGTKFSFLVDHNDENEMGELIGKWSEVEVVEVDEAPIPEPTPESTPGATGLAAVFALRHGEGIGYNGTLINAGQWAQQSGFGVSGTQITVRKDNEIAAGVDWRGFTVVWYGRNGLITNGLFDTIAPTSVGTVRFMNGGRVEKATFDNSVTRKNRTMIRFADTQGQLCEISEVHFIQAGVDAVKGPGSAIMEINRCSFDGCYIPLGSSAHLDQIDMKGSLPGSYVKDTYIGFDYYGGGLGKGANNLIRQMDAPANGILYENILGVGSNDPGTQSYLLHLSQNNSTSIKFVNCAFDPRQHSGILYPATRDDNYAIWDVSGFDYDACVAAGKLTLGAKIPAASA